MFKSKNVPPEIQAIMVEAITSAAFICVFAYISMWIIFSTWSDVTQSYPTLFRINACAFIFEAILLYQFMQYCKKTPNANLKHKQTIITTYLLVSALQWSITTTFLIYSGSLSIEQQYSMRLISIGLAGIAGVLLSITNLTGVVFAVVIVSPHLVASYWVQDPQANFLTLLTVAFWLFLYISTQSIKRNYFLQFVSSYKLAQVHADSMEYLSKKDIITKVNNRYHWSVNFQSQWAKSQHKKKPICLIGIRVNHLDEIIESHGYQTGDAIMRSVASHLQASVKNPDLLGRYSGNEFMLAVLNLDYDQAASYANTLAQDIEEKLYIPGELSAPLELTSTVTASTELAVDSAESMIELLQRKLQVR